MSSAIIKEFLTSRKEKSLKDSIKSGMDEETISEIISLTNEAYNQQNWIPDAAKKSQQISIASHIGKFTSPSSKATPIMFDGERRNDGLLRSGNADFEVDSYSSSRFIPIFKFLSLTFKDGRTLFEHLKADTDEVKKALKLSEEVYEEARELFLKADKIPTDNISTSGRLKQVFFPIGDGDYHLLSLMTSSRLLFSLKEKITNIKFSEDSKQARADRRENKPSDKEIVEIYDLTLMRFGGSKPQNVSFLNNKNGGTTLLLNSLPPSLDPDRIRLPRNDFFTEILHPKKFQFDFEWFHQVLKDGRNNIDIRNERDKLIKKICLKGMASVWDIRVQKEGWTSSDHYIDLPTNQKIWLDADHEDKRPSRLEPSIINSFVEWFLTSYEKNIEDSLKMKDEEFEHIKKIVKSLERKLS